MTLSGAFLAYGCALFSPALLFHPVRVSTANILVSPPLFLLVPPSFCRPHLRGSLAFHRCPALLLVAPTESVAPTVPSLVLLRTHFLDAHAPGSPPPVSAFAPILRGLTYWYCSSCSCAGESGPAFVFFCTLLRPHGGRKLHEPTLPILFDAAA